jgi:integral membrane sensor domain MASE1
LKGDFPDFGLLVWPCFAPACLLGFSAVLSWLSYQSPTAEALNSITFAVAIREAVHLIRVRNTCYFGRVSLNVKSAKSAKQPGL